MKLLILILFILTGCGGETAFDFSGFVEEAVNGGDDETTESPPTYSSTPTNDIDLTLGLAIQPAIQFDSTDIEIDESGNIVWRTTTETNEQYEIQISGQGEVSQTSDDSSFGNRPTVSVESSDGITIDGLNFNGGFTRFVVFSDNSNTSSSPYEPKVFSEGYDPAQNVGSKRKVWINGELDNSYDDGTGNPAELDFTGGDFSLGNIAEILFFDERLSDADILIIDERLRRKYGIEPTCYVPKNEVGYNFGDCQGNFEELYAVSDCTLSCSNNFSGEDLSLECRRLGEKFIPKGCYLPSEEDFDQDVESSITDVNTRE